MYVKICICAALVLIATLFTSNTLAEGCEVSGGGIFEDFYAPDTATGSCRNRARFSGTITIPRGEYYCDSSSPEGEFELQLSDGRVFTVTEFFNLDFRIDGIDIASARGLGDFEGELIQFVLQFEGKAGRPGTDVDWIVIEGYHYGGSLDGTVVFRAEGEIVGGLARLVPD